MSTRSIRGLIVAVLVLELGWYMILPAGNRLSPGSPETAQALRAFETNRTPATEAAMWEQVHRDDLRDSRRKGVLFGLMLFVDLGAIYLFWNYGVKKAAA